jgi:hypothetical protein
VKGAETKASAVKLGSRPISERITLAFQNPVPPRSNPGSTIEIRQFTLYFSRIWRRECQSIPIDVKAVFHSSTWEPTVLATSHWPIPCARCAPSLCAIFRRPARGRRPGHLRLRRRRSEDAERADRSQRLLEELRAAVLNGHSRGGLPQVRQLKDALRGKTCCSCFLFFQVKSRKLNDAENLAKADF